MRATSSLHAGEQTIQISLAYAMHEPKGAAVIRDYMPEQHRTFFAALSFNGRGIGGPERPSLGTTPVRPPGFISSPHETSTYIKAGSIGAIHAFVYSGWRPGRGTGNRTLNPSPKPNQRRVENCIADEGFP